MSPAPRAFTWDVLSAAPSVVVHTRPDRVSSSWRPALTVRAQWGSEEPPPLGNALLRFQFQLLGSRDLGVFHSPPSCPEDLASLGVGSARLPVDCVDAGCDGTGCVYRLALPRVPGTSSSYTLQIRSRLLSAYGRTDTEAWNHVVCSTLQYAVLSGNDTVVCLPCPEGGDCSGGTLASLLAAVPGAANAVVQQQHIVARQGYWASPNSSGLAYDKCPNTNAVTCLQGVNGTRSRCAAGYRGLVCNVCDHGYVHTAAKRRIPCAQAVLSHTVSTSARAVCVCACVWHCISAGTLSSTGCVPAALRLKAPQASLPPWGSLCYLWSSSVA